MEEHHSLPYFDNVPNSDTLFNLTATSPQKSPRALQSSQTIMDNSSTFQQLNDCDQGGDGVVNLSPFKSRLACKERAHRIITNIFELELDQQRHQNSIDQ